MVIPWLGFSLSELLNKVKIKPSAKFVEFETVYNPEEMVGQRYPVLNWPYIEGLRIDEAMHPLTTVVTGLYGKSSTKSKWSTFKNIYSVEVWF